MIRHHLALAFFLLGILSAWGGNPGWGRDFEAARGRAVKEDKDLVLNFTGSDWCGVCQKLSHEVFSKEEFAQGAAKAFVLVEVDFPDDELLLPPATRTQNQALAERYGINLDHNIPTLVLADSTGRPYARTGFRPMGADAYLAHLMTLRAVRVRRDAAFAEAASKEGVAKGAILGRALATLPAQDLEAFYGDRLAELKGCDPGDQSGFFAARDYDQALARFDKQFAVLLGGGRFDQALQTIETFLATHRPTGEARQEILMNKAMIHVELRDREAVMQQLDEIKALDPESKLGAEIDETKAGLESYFDEVGSEEEGSSE